MEYGGLPPAILLQKKKFLLKFNSNTTYSGYTCVKIWLRNHELLNTILKSELEQLSF